MYRIILASESPRRKEIMNQMGIPFESIPSHVNEELIESSPSDIVENLANLKAKDVAKQLMERQHPNMSPNNEQVITMQEDLIIIGADTMVFHSGQALGKPRNREDAINMLKSLSDDSHEVISGVCIIIRKKTNHDSEKIISFSVKTQVVTQPLTIEEIESYVDSGESMDKAGAYGIQGGFGLYIKEIHGDYYNVVGFPIAKIYEKLLAYGINIKKLK